MLVDCGPDLRQQLLAAEVGRLDGVIVTHAHGDHCHGIDELQAGCRRRSAARCRSTRARDVLDELELRFAYAFEQSDFYRPIVEAREIADGAAASAMPRSASSTSRMAARHRSGCASTKADARSAYAVDFSELTR